MKEPIRLMIVDDHPVVRQGLVGLLADEPGVIIVAQARNVEEACSQYAEAKPDVALLDLRLPDGSGVDVISRIRVDFPSARFVVFTTYDADEDIYRAIEAGARGYLLKDTFGVELIEIIEAVAAGRRCIPDSIVERLAARVRSPDLTVRETDVLGLIAKGFSNKEIAKCLTISEGTVKSHVVHILDKLGVRDRTGAVSIALERGIIRLR